MMIQFVWSSEAIKTATEKNGGVPAHPIAICLTKGYVVWEPTGEVRFVPVNTDIKA